MALTATSPAGSRDTRLVISDPPAGTTETKWEINPVSAGDTFTMTTTSSGIDSGNVSSSNLITLNIWLPPFHDYALRTKHLTSGNWGSWSSSTEFSARGILNSFEKYQALNGTSGVDNVDFS